MLLKILNKKEKRDIVNKIKNQWGFNGRLDYVFLINKKNKLYIIGEGIKNINLDKLKIDSVGLYFGELIKKELRLSIEGSQIIGPNSDKNIIELNEKEKMEWLKGNDLNNKNRRSFCRLKPAVFYPSIFGIENCRTKVRGIKPTIFNKEIKKGEEKINGFIIIKNNEDYLGTGKVKENKILNYVPKQRRLPI